VSSTSARGNQRCTRSCSSTSSSAVPAVRPVARNTSNPWLDVPLAQYRCPRWRISLAVMPVSCRSSSRARYSGSSAAAIPGSVPCGELPGPLTHRVAVLLDQVEPAVLGRDDQREVGLVHVGVDAARAVGPPDLVLAHPQVRRLVRHPRRQLLDRRPGGLAHRAHTLLVAG